MLLTGIGDVVHGLPLANDLRRHHPQAEIVWVAEPAPAQVVRHHPAVDHVVAFDKRAGVRGLGRLARDLAPLRCDLSINFMRYAKSIAPTLLLRAPRRLGLPRDKTRDGVHLFSTERLPGGPWQHTQDQFLAFRAPLGIPHDDPVEWRITFTSDEEDAAHDEFTRLRDAAGGPIVGLVLGSANAAKDWPAERAAELARRLTDELGALVLLIGGPSPAERQAAAMVQAQHAGPGLVDGLGDSVRAMMWRVRGVDLLVSPDTGPLHLAHAMGTPVVGLFGHTNPARVGPWRDSRQLTIDHYTDPGEPPDASRYDPRHGRMETIEVDEVLERVRQGFSAPTPKRASRAATAASPESSPESGPESGPDASPDSGPDSAPSPGRAW